MKARLFNGNSLSSNGDCFMKLKTLFSEKQLTRMFDNKKAECRANWCPREDFRESSPQGDWSAWNSNILASSLKKLPDADRRQVETGWWCRHTEMSRTEVWETEVFVHGFIYQTHWVIRPLALFQIWVVSLNNCSFTKSCVSGGSQR